VVGKFSQLQPFIANPTPQPLAKGSGSSVRPLSVKRRPELHFFFDDYRSHSLYFPAAARIFSTCNNYMF
jgi:hypothetical protein